jgi:transposase
MSYPIAEVLGRVERRRRFSVEQKVAVLAEATHRERICRRSRAGTGYCRPRCTSGAWHDGIGMSLYAKRLERGRFIWPSPADGIVAISAAQLAYMLDGIDWRNPVRTWRPEVAG